MKVQKQFLFKNGRGEDIFLFSLQNRNGTVVTISNYGAIIISYTIRKNSLENDIVLGFDNIEGYFSNAYLKEYPWFGAAIGRYGNRIANAQFTLEGKQYQLSRNNNNDQLHGGLEGFDKKVWMVSLFDESKLVLKLKSVDGDEGFPGNIEVMLSFTLADDDSLTYEYEARTDQTTILNLTHHSYFNLNNGKGDILDHEIRIPASHVLRQKENLVATGALMHVANTSFDFRNWKRISENWDPKVGYDQSFELDDKSKSPKLAAEARSKKSKTRMEIWSTEPVVHFYSGLWIPELQGKHNTTYTKFSGFCLETQIHPNAINIPSFPNTILHPGEIYRHVTTYKVYLDEEK